MDSIVAVVVVIGLFSLVAIAAFLVFRRRTRVDIKGPLGTGMELDGSNEPAPDKPGVTVRDARTREGGLLADDRTGRGAEVERVDTKDDIVVSSSPSAQRAVPKDDPPA